ncbi:MAG: hypothetical protein K6G82_07560 [Ruminococcus sp.]|nr:hypothetical protein [Ruminococcus sp.]
MSFLGDDDGTVTMTATATTGKIIQVDLLGYTSNTTTSPSFDLYWYDSPHNFNISSYSNVKYFRVVLKYKDGSTLIPEEVASCVIECNYTYPWYMDGDQPTPIAALPIVQEHLTEPYPDSLWRYEGGDTPVTGLMPPILQERFTKPYPASLWRIDESNGGLPYNELMLDVLYYEPDEPDIYPELRENVIRVYDKSEPQDGFRSNGLAVLCPTSCISLHNDDRWDIKLKHPIDEWGKWKHLLVVNIIKVDGQLYRIKRQKPYIDSSGAYIEVEAKHITTDLADECCKDSEFEGGTASDFIAWAKSNVMRWEDERYADPYSFNITAMYDGTLMPETYPPATLLGLLIGLDNSLLARTGGELYRDNFDISIRPRMQGARENAFYIRYSLDMVEISQEIDYSDFCTLLYCYDNWGNVWAVSYAGTIQWAIHHQITKIVKFNYAEYDPERFSADCDAMKAASFKPKVTYKMKMAALKNDPKYADFLNLQNYRYGDSGTIYCPELDIETVQKIIEVEKDELTGEIVSITLGNLNSSILRPTFMGSTISSGYSVDDKNAYAMQRLLVGNNIASLQKFPIKRLRIYTIKTLQGG